MGNAILPMIRQVYYRFATPDMGKLIVTEATKWSMSIVLQAISFNISWNSTFVFIPLPTYRSPVSRVRERSQEKPSG